MLKMSCLTVAEQPMLPMSIPVVHPFYRDSFANLYQIDKNILVTDERPFPKENYNFLLEVLRGVMTKAPKEQVPAYFFDIRLTEEFCQTAPDYALLEGLNLRRTQPLSIKGMGSLALIQGLKLAELYLNAGECALVCCAELDTEFDRQFQDEPCRKACGFLINYDSQEHYSDKIDLELFDFCRSYNDVSFPSETFVFKSQKNDMLGPLFHFARDKLLSRMTVLLEYGELYGFYQIYRDQS